MSTLCAMNALWVALALVATTQASPLPKNWKVCKLSDPNRSECLKEAFTIALKDLINGNPSLGVEPLDPLRIKKLVVKQDGPGTNIEMTLTDVEHIGLKDLVVDHIETDWKTVKLSGHAPQMKIRGNYKMKGTFMSIPVDGEGKAEMIGEGLKPTLTLQIVEKQVNGVAYNAIDGSSLEIDVNRVRFNFDHLDEKLNKGLNDNWKELWQLIKKSFEAGVRTYAVDIAAGIFDKIPRNELAPK